MNKLFLINEIYYVIAFDYYDAITIFQKYKKEYTEDIIHKIELVNDQVIQKQTIETQEDGENDE